MTAFILVHKAEKLGPRRPKIIVNAISMPSFVPKPQRKAQANPLPMHEMRITTRKDM